MNPTPKLGWNVKGLELSICNSFWKLPDIEGKFKGILAVSGTLSLRASAQIDGDVQIEQLSVEPGATFNASCVMKGSVKALKSEIKTASPQNNSNSEESA